jgi:hypothetical protein
VSGDQDAEQPARQEIRGDRDAFAAGRDLTINNYFRTAEQRPVDPAMSASLEAGPQRQVWGGVPARNPRFVGRRLLTDIRNALECADHGKVRVLHGIGGASKTQLAAEYTHQFADKYDIVWWVAAERAALIGKQLAALARELGCAPPGSPLAVVQRAVLMSLQQRQRWLLVFDNAERPEDIAGWRLADLG